MADENMNIAQLENQQYLESEILNGIESSNYQWVALSALERECQINRNRISQILPKIKGIISATSEKGDVVYSTIKHWYEKANWHERLMMRLAYTMRWV